MYAGSLALAFAAALAGAGLYLNWVEQPSRLSLDDSALLSEWAPSDQRGFALLASLALVSAICGLSAWFSSGDVRFAIGAIIVILVWPYAFFVMAPLNNQILTLKSGDVGAARALVRQWGLLEYGQTAIALVATVIYPVGALNPSRAALRRLGADLGANVRFFTRLPWPGAGFSRPDFAQHRLGGAAGGRAGRAHGRGRADGRPRPAPARDNGGDDRARRHDRRDRRAARGRPRRCRRRFWRRRDARAQARNSARQPARNLWRRRAGAFAAAARGGDRRVDADGRSLCDGGADAVRRAGAAGRAGADRHAAAGARRRRRAPAPVSASERRNCGRRG